MALFDRLIRATVRKHFLEAVEREAPRLIEDYLTRKFREEPEIDLTNVGFGWAMALALREFWPEVDQETAARWMWGYLDIAGVRFGDPAYEWTPRAARELAQNYIEEFGETA